jgi:serine/threonine-protein kinase
VPAPIGDDAAVVAFKSAIARSYLIDEEIGRGGTAIVYLARELRFGRTVAVKVLAPPFVAFHGSSRFLREIGHTARLGHPNILPLLDAGEAAGLPFHVTRYVRGGSLRQLIVSEGGLPLARALAIARGVAAALQFAHDRRIVHGDVKPENVLLDGDHPYLADFGIARAFGTEWFASPLTAASPPGWGTPSYVSPEQAAGDDDIDGRSDLFSLACVVYELLAGDAPFHGENTAQMVAGRFRNEAPDLRTLPRAVPAGVTHAISEALALQPDRRHRSVSAFVHALERAAAGSRVPGWRAADACRRVGRSVAQAAARWFRRAPPRSRHLLDRPVPPA